MLKLMPKLYQCELKAWATIFLTIIEDRIVIDYEIEPIKLIDERKSRIQHVYNQIAYPGKDVILRICLDNDFETSELFTDSNGYFFVKRPRNQRTKDPIPSMYFPIVSQAFLKSDSKQFTVTINRAAGVASLKPNELEIMLHRRGLSDDCKGLKEGLDDTSSTTGQIFADFGDLSSFRLKVSEKQMSHSMVEVDKKYEDLIQNFEGLSEGIHLLDLHIDDFNKNWIVIRLENLKNQNILLQLACMLNVPKK